MCAHYRIPYSTFIGRAPAPGEPLWTEDDAALALAWHRYQRNVHGPCGEHMADWMDPATGKELKDPPKEVVAWHCPACELLRDAEDDELLKKPGNFPTFKPYPEPDDQPTEGD